MDFDSQAKLLEQRRNRFLQQQDVQGPDGQMVGGRYIAANPLEYLAAGLRGYGGMRGEQMANQELKDLQTQKQSAMKGDMSRMVEALRGTPEKTISAPSPFDTEGAGQFTMPAKQGGVKDFYGAAMESQFPQFQQMGMQGALSSAQDEAKAMQTQQQQQRISDILANSTPQEAIRAGIPKETVIAYHDQNLGKSKVGRTIDVIGANGEKMTQQIDEYGNAMGAPIPTYTAPVQVNQGGQVSFVVPKAGVNLPVTMSPSEKDASERGWATVQQGQERIGIEKTKAASGGAGGGDKPLTEGQAKGSLYLGQMRGASKELENLETAGGTRKAQSVASPAGVAAAGSTWTNWATSKEARKVAQIQNQWSEAFLRAKTGAAATPAEVELNNRTFFPVFGEDDETSAQKAKMRKQAEQDMEFVAGKGAAKAGIHPEGAWDAPTTAPAAPKARIKFDAQGNPIQ